MKCPSLPMNMLLSTGADEAYVAPVAPIKVITPCVAEKAVPLNGARHGLHKEGDREREKLQVMS